MLFRSEGLVNFNEVFDFDVDVAGGVRDVGAFANILHPDGVVDDVVLSDGFRLGLQEILQEAAIRHGGRADRVGQAAILEGRRQAWNAVAG